MFLPKIMSGSQIIFKTAANNKTNYTAKRWSLFYMQSNKTNSSKVKVCVLKKIVALALLPIMYFNLIDLIFLTSQSRSFLLK